MEQNNVSPGQYSAPSTAGSALAGGAGGAIMGGLKWGLLWIGALAAGGAYLGFTLATGGAGALIPAWGLVGGVIGGVVGLIGGSYTYAGAAGLGAVVGGVSGASRASRRAQEQQVALDMMQAQAMPAQPYRAFPAAGSQFNQASSLVQADSVQRDGPIAGQALQRA